MDAVPLTTKEDHDRVMEIPTYRRFYEARADWMYRWEQRRRAQADKKRERARARYEAEIEKIDAWLYGPEGRVDDLAYEAFQAENDKRYWALRRV